MHKSLQLSYESIVEDLMLPEVKEFKIGITHDIDTRREDYASEGYSELYELAEGSNSLIIQAESDLIATVLNDKRVKAKCSNKTAAQGVGQIQMVDKLYVAVKIEFSDTVEAIDLHLEQVLFSNGFPITLI